MTVSHDAARPLFRLELADALRSRWLAFTSLTYALVFGAFLWLGLRESAVLGFTGLSRVVLNVGNAVVVGVPLAALVATSQSIVRARGSGFFELFLAQPCHRRDWFQAAVAARFVVIVAPLGVLFLGAAALGRFVDPTDGALLPMVLRALGITAALTWAFLGVGFWVSSVARTPERATVLALLAWMAGSALHDFALIGALLRFHLPAYGVFALAAANPVEAARIAILGGVDPELSVLGPVGFWLANVLGPRLLLAVGVGWPALLGSALLALAARRLDRADLVA
jgi:ABC-2 type transport system permease protein